MKPLAGTLRKVVMISFPFWPQFVLLGLVTLLIPVTGLIAPYIFGKIADGLFYRRHADYGLASFATFTLALNIFLGWVQTRENFRRIGYGLGLKLHLASLEKLSNLSLGQVSQGIAERKDMIVKGIHAIKGSIERLFTRALPVVFLLVVTIVCLTAKHWLVGTITVSCVIGYIASSIRINCRIYPRARDYHEHDSQIDMKFGEKIELMPLVIQSDRGKSEILDFKHRYAGFQRKGEDLWIGYITLTTVLRDPYCFACLTLNMFLSMYLVAKGEISPGSFIVIMGWSAGAFSGMSSIGPLQREFMYDWSSIVRYLEFQELEPEVRRPRCPIQLSGFEESIAFENVRFRAQSGPKRPWSLNASFSIEPGSFTAIVGPSGSGKSTALNLLRGGYALDHGRITIDGCDINSVDLAMWRRSIGFVDQHPLFWNESLLYNILYGINGKGTEISEKDLLMALRIARLGHFYDDDRLHKPIGERGGRLSGGERQRVAIARAIIGRPSILVFDEAMSSLDTENEAKVLETILELAKQKDKDGRRMYTIIAATHSMATAALADTVIVFENGSVVGCGRHEDLLLSCEIYRRLSVLEMLDPRLGSVPNDMLESPFREVV